MQKHKRPVTARSIVCLAAICCLPMAAMQAQQSAESENTQADEAEFVSLFDGQTLNGWTGATDQYEIVDGVLASKEGGSGKLLTEGQYENFEIRFEFQLTPGANNGLALRAPQEGDAAYDGMESQILDNSADKYANLAHYQYHGSIYGVAAAKRGALKPVGQWNEQQVRCSARSVEVQLNGEVIVDVNLDKVAPDGRTIDGRPHPGLSRSSGHIGFLSHGDRVRFRNIRIRQLP